MWYIVLGIVIVIVVLLFIATTASAIFASTFEKYDLIKSAYSQPTEKVLTKLLILNDLNDVKLSIINGQFTDCYIPKQKTIALSESTYKNNSVAAIAIGAHEFGHALQHSKKSPIYVFEHILSWICRIISKLILPTLLLGIIFILFPSLQHTGIILLWCCVGALGCMILLKLILIPVEFDASKKAMIELSKYEILTKKELSQARKVLDRAAGTYIADFIGMLIGVNLIRRKK